MNMIITFHNIIASEPLTIKLEIRLQRPQFEFPKRGTNSLYRLDINNTRRSNERPPIKSVLLAICSADLITGIVNKLGGVGRML